MHTGTPPPLRGCWGGGSPALSWRPRSPRQRVTPGLPGRPRLSPSLGGHSITTPFTEGGEGRRGHTGVTWPCRCTHVFPAWRVLEAATLCLTLGLNQGPHAAQGPGRPPQAVCVCGSEATWPRAAQPCSIQNWRSRPRTEQKVFRAGVGAVGAGVGGDGCVCVCVGGVGTRVQALRESSQRVCACASVCAPVRAEGTHECRPGYRCELRVLRILEN